MSLYLDLMKRVLLDQVYDPNSSVEGGHAWPPRAHTMIGRKRLDNVQHCCEDALSSGVPGDFIETGVWRGGATIFMRAILKAHGVSDRSVWVVDSFEGCPPPNIKRYPLDADSHLHEEASRSTLAVPLVRVKANFARYGLLDEQVHFLKGWFRDTLPVAVASGAIRKVAVLRLDGDLYESTTNALVNLYPRLSVGGYCIVDDYGVIEACATAVQDYRASRDIRDEIMHIDHSGIFWRKSCPLKNLSGSRPTSARTCSIAVSSRSARIQTCSTAVS